MMFSYDFFVVGVTVVSVVVIVIILAAADAAAIFFKITIFFMSLSLYHSAYIIVLHG